MPNVIEAEIMKNHGVPVFLQEFVRDVSRHIIIHFGEVLRAVSELVMTR